MSVRSLTFLAAALLVPALARGQRAIDIYQLQVLKPILCVPKTPGPVSGRTTEFYDPEGRSLYLADDSAQDEVAIVEEKKLPLFQAMLEFSAEDSNKCPHLSTAKLRELCQVYAIGEFIAFDAPANRVHLRNGVYSETMTFLYIGKDGVVHVGEEKIVGDDGMLITEADRNEGGTGYQGQKQSQRVGKLHTHPNADGKGFFPTPAHHPSGQDRHQKDSPYYDVIVSPKYVYLINGKYKSMAFWREAPFSIVVNPVRDYNAKLAEADAVHKKTGKWPPWFNEDFNNKNNPWAQ